MIIYKRCDRWTERIFITVQFDFFIEKKLFETRRPVLSLHYDVMFHT